ncbi:leucine--tRNA ligase [Zunongwangia sp. F260]|uniref:Leucine--tRNA ligase n=1 Tax=Autumnicola lenta TaxID=3075593 RepID=A0ABU3CKT4_9FLAO|nr:leucine--tRNA ligase [Zunongwangia sp. F260]MDT0646931.1 leucine--tRNA ligase [Zunongwangia sp. F260]
MNYNFNEIEAKWQKYWADNQTFKAKNPGSPPSEGLGEAYYVLDMFPYPSGAGLHVGHPLGYIASDIYARYKRHKGFNVLHPQGYDSFGLPAEQYAIQTGQHPAVTTENNIKRYREQLDKIGFSFDWSREVRTSNPEYYKWTQWIFIQLFESWYDHEQDKSRAISELEEIFASEGNTKVKAACDDDVEDFTAEEWNAFSSEEKQKILLKYRLTYLAETEVNWCPQLGTVLANDEIVNGVSERGGYPVVRKKMTQWSMRISAFAERLLQDLDKIDWTESLKESQRNWIGKSVGAMVEFPILSFPEGEEKAQRGYMTGGNNSHLLLEKARENRNDPTDAERILWKHLRNKNLGYKFRQQHLIYDFIVDFVCLSKRLVLEVDGGIHDLQIEEDENRTAIIESKGFKVLRFKNAEVIGDIDAVLEKIETALSGQPHVSEKVQKAPPSGAGGIRVFTTRPDTIFGVTFMTLAPEHELVKKITTPEQKEEVEAYIAASAKRSERERMADVKSITGVFTGAYAEHPFTKEPVPIWIGDYVLAGYGTGAVMAVPCGDQRDYDFAKHFDLPIINIFENADISEEAFSGKEGTVIANSDFLSGLKYKEALQKAILELEKLGLGYGKTNYRLRDAVFSRQRYWGEPFPIYYNNGLPHPIPEHCLPLELPEVEKYLPTEEGEPPLGRAEKWHWDEKNEKVISQEEFESSPLGGGGGLELNTMPGWAGSSWYLFRYMDPHNEETFVSKEAKQYWENVDLYIGGSEHATGHLLYSRFWTKFLKDRGYLTVKEPFKKLINQGMILGTSAFVYRLEGENVLISKNLVGKNAVQPIHADVSLVNSSDELDIEGFKKWRPEFADSKFLTEEDGKYVVGREVEKMSKSKYNVVNPDDICENYGADTLRMYEMFLGPLEQAKPWNTAGITGVHNFLKKLWKLYHSSPSPSEGGENSFSVSDEPASKDSLKTLHKTIKKVTEDIENFSFNTSVSTFMICVNELSAQNCNQREVLEPLAVLIAPYAPHIAEELWSKLGNSESVVTAVYPVYEEKFLVESTKNYPISFNGKMRFTMELPLDISKEEIEKTVLEDERSKSYLSEATPKKVIVVPGKIVNIVI